MLSTSKTSFRNPTGGADPYFPYVPLLLETTSTNGQQNNTFLDSSTNNFTITRNGTTTQGSVTPYWPNGYWSNYFNGTTDYLSVPATAFVLTGDFTVESWMWIDSTVVSSRPDNLKSVSVFSGSGNVSGTMVFEVQGSASSAGTGLSVYQDSPSVNLSASVSIPLNSWVHIAFVRTGTTIYGFVNGQRITLGTSSTTLISASGSVAIGRNQNTIYYSYMKGYISNHRVVKGTAVYTANFAPSTTPLTAITNTSLLTCQSNRFLDNSTNNFTLTVNGTPRVQAFQPFSPVASYTAATYGGSGYFNGSTDYLTIPSDSAFQFTNVNTTIECYIFIPSGTIGNSIEAIYNKRSGSNTGYFNGITYSGGNFYQWWWIDNTSIFTLNTGTVIPVGQWVHLAWVRNGNTFTMYINGQQNLTTTNTITVTSNAANVEIGASPTYNQYFIGYISNFRVVNGTAVYTANFTPPTTPLTAITNTSLLLNFTNAGVYDAAVQNNVITIGDAQASTTQSKWSPTSMKFDGTGDWLTAIDGPQLQLGTGDFTIDGWVYLSATGVAYGIISKGTASTGWSVNVTSGNKLQFSYTASNLTGATSLASATWYYFAVVRSGSATGNLKVYLNGTVDATSGGAVTDNFNQTSILYVGADRVGGSALNGYLQDLRITKGVARTITTPTAAFPTR
jgi:hypothetical protein